MRLVLPLLAVVCWLAGAGRTIASDKPAPAGEIVILRDVPYRDGASPAWRLDLALRKDPGGKARPGIVVIHGGWLEGDKSSFTTRAQGVPGNIEEFADLGFVAATINYRLSREAPYPAALDDCKCAVRWLRAHAGEYQLDPGRIGAYGNSAGGHLAMLLGLSGQKEGLERDIPYPEQSSAVQAVVSDSGPIDLLAQYRQNQLREVISRFLGGPPDGERSALYEKASPAHRILADTPPMMLIHGVDDEQVPVASADAFVAALGRAGRTDVSYYRLARVGHCPHSLARVPALRPVVNEFFLRTLRPSKTR